MYLAAIVYSIRFGTGEYGDFIDNKTHHACGTIKIIFMIDKKAFFLSIFFLYYF